MDKNKKLTLNISMNIVYLILNYMITFFLASYLTQELGDESYGFIGLCNNIINYSQVITVALNSVSCRFIAIEIHRGNKKSAQEYFSSTFYANLLLAALFSLVFIPMCINLDKIFDIPVVLVDSVKVLFFLSYLNMVVSILQTVFNVSTLITNEVYLTSIANIAGSVSRIFILLILFYGWGASLAFSGAATLVSTGMVCILHILYTKKLVPELQIQRKWFSLNKIQRLFFSGIWSSISRLSQILSDGLDLVISNVFVGALAMGQLSLAYLIPGFVISSFSMLINCFNPILTELYAKRQMEGLKKEIKFFMKLNGYAGIILFWGLVFCGREFYMLWVPGTDTEMIYRLMLISCMSMLVSAVVNPLSAIYVIADKLRFYSIFNICVSIFDIIVELVLLKLTPLGIYAIAGVSKVVGILVCFFFVPIYSSYCLKFDHMEFYPTMGRYFFASGMTGAVLFFIAYQIKMRATTWPQFVVQVIVVGSIAAICGSFFILDKKERKRAIVLIASYIHKGR